MKLMASLFGLVIGILLILFAFGYLSFSCDERVGGSSSPELSGSKEKDIKEYNIQKQKEFNKNRTTCDTLSLQEFIVNNFPAGINLIEFDRTFTYNIPKPAVIYYKEKNKNYIFAMIAKSKEGERYIEKKNVIGYESSFINLDSTKLGTAFFYLALFTCDNGTFTELWEAETPMHGGFNSMKAKKWKFNNTLYVQLNFEDGIISGHRNFNFFLVDGIENKPHLLETYVGIINKRTLANVNNDKYPDYYEYRFNAHHWQVDSLYQIKVLDSIPFYWSDKRQLYITNKNPRWYRKY